MDDETLMFIEVGGNTAAGKWIECRKLSTIQRQPSLHGAEYSALCRILSRPERKDQTEYDVNKFQLQRGPRDIPSCQRYHCWNQEPWVTTLTERMVRVICIGYESRYLEK